MGQHPDRPSVTFGICNALPYDGSINRIMGGVKMSDEDSLLLITCVSAAVLLAGWFWIVW